MEEYGIEFRIFPTMILNEISLSFLQIVLNW